MDKKLKILITGASSYLGARLYFDLLKDFDVVGTYNTSKLIDNFLRLDITKNDEINAIFEKVKPSVIVHVAANASSKWCEENPDLAVKLNETATKYIVDLANKIKAKVIYISSFAAFEPNNLYAKTKYNSEKIVKNTKTGWIILRPSLILGFSPNIINDRPFNRLLKNLDGVPAEYDISWKFQPTYIGHISEVIKEVITRNINNETIPVAVSDLKSRFDTAKDILTPFGIEVKPFDAKDNAHFSEKKEINKLKELNLPIYTYQKMIEKIIEEIKNREQFKL
ncbi:MAG: putative nad-dependent epimerase/dehydratase,dtdp-4-dehydrorhamnose reductase, oxidoreductase protein [Candidatus Woesebacteria bacterium GW2011_GWA1_33_30]|uniref:dTDP-4-dehydrorhamnose reductase n=1 Tax=Candidatus Woesebacteria bacterium GW2011_GWA2_33_28 TaxID=1618561 RepID=A0A0F9ZV01_9BACT|nr:MAG: putative nad-dependent epimerase/dehydratase,dtdp-4-dehydrorhamnose reductase, oxidoreductase protein [Candidatus Woesebacteria bacterium GW2011_GWA2_33_28]KKP48985.1 MAG: putative nad-dependent epimerase/dehydratase,dtdp-4-dehydrorhamnose reductase, oxidoreductase protein [Candidatus Woesebacteria bacterium GW2011_GWA1_33_30]KKP49907.1 MAG: putative nad-dependent epimerase/dehydratase,dtdp-4-dehydrorhamnose reductase, oxidoreductase protein [Microgenomates group bacterium GW2011_GWC1_33_